MNEKIVDLVLEGGGVKGIGLVGAYSVLEKNGYSLHRIGGTSAGAAIAAMVASGYSAAELQDIVLKLDYRSLADEGFIDHFGIPGKSLSLLFEKGIYEGNHLQNLVLELLEKKGIRTFGDLKIRQPESDDIKDLYKLVIVASDVTRGKTVRLPWDYHEYGLDPDTQLVADAVKMSAAVPFYYEPVRLGDSYIADGAITASFPIWLFENGPHEHNKVRPTFGIKLSARESAHGMDQTEKITNTFNYAFAILQTMINAQDQLHLNEPCTLHRTMFVDADDVSIVDFSLSKEKREKLYQNGVAAGEKFLNRWDYQKFLKGCILRED